MIFPAPAEHNTGTKYKKEIFERYSGQKSRKELQQRITTKIYNKEKTEDRIYRGLPFFHCYYSSYSSSSDSSPSLSSPEEFSLLSS